MAILKIVPDKDYQVLMEYLSDSDVVLLRNLFSRAFLLKSSGSSTGWIRRARSTTTLEATLTSM